MRRRIIEINGARVKKTLIALALSALANLQPAPVQWQIKPAVRRLRQHPSVQRGKSGVARLRRSARKKRQVRRG